MRGSKRTVSRCPGIRQSGGARSNRIARQGCHECQRVPPPTTSRDRADPESALDSLGAGETAWRRPKVGSTISGGRRDPRDTHKGVDRLASSPQRSAIGPASRGSVLRTGSTSSAPTSTVSLSASMACAAPASRWSQSSAPTTRSAAPWYPLLAVRYRGVMEKRNHRSTRPTGYSSD